MLEKRRTGTHARTKRRLIIGILLPLGWMGLQPLRPLPFNSYEWQQFHLHFRGLGWGIYPWSDTSRARMVDDLIRKKLKPGLSFEEGRAILGEPEVAGSGYGTSTIPYQQDGYDLVYQPLLELSGVLLRWRTREPGLLVRYEYGRLVSIRVE